MLSALIDLLERVPKTNKIASIILDFPDPLGPMRQLNFVSNLTADSVPNDLNPFNLISLI